MNISKTVSDKNKQEKIISAANLPETTPVKSPTAKKPKVKKIKPEILAAADLLIAMAEKEFGPEAFNTESVDFPVMADSPIPVETTPATADTVEMSEEGLERLNIKSGVRLASTRHGKVIHDGKRYAKAMKKRLAYWQGWQAVFTAQAAKQAERQYFPGGFNASSAELGITDNEVLAFNYMCDNMTVENTANGWVWTPCHCPTKKFAKELESLVVKGILQTQPYELTLDGSLLGVQNVGTPKPGHYVFTIWAMRVLELSYNLMLDIALQVVAA